MHQIACHACDLIHDIPPMPSRAAACCVRCGSVLFRAKPNSIDRTLAWTLAGLVLYAIAVSYPFLAMKIGSVVQQTSLLGGVQQLFNQGIIPLATLVLLTCVVIPLIQMLSLLYVFIPLKLKTQSKFAIPVFRLLGHIKPWSMMEIYMLGILVSIVKLGKMATIVPGLAVIAFSLLIFVLAFALSSVDHHMVWERLGGKFAKVTNPSEKTMKLVSCEACHLLSRWPKNSEGQIVCCPRCSGEMHQRKPNSLMRTWALLIAAIIFYIPANVLPMTITSAVGSTSADTIMSGVIYFIHSGSWEIALVIFTASIFVPFMKFIILIYLLLSVQFKSIKRPKKRTRFYHFTEAVGRWSMLDVYVVSILISLVKLGFLADIAAGPAVIYFAAVVVTTMLAAESFDPRLIWDVVEEKS
ncbi:MAG: paraquat-inducible protein A [Desulfuromusa sp.]|nr:paraquat-inducible protein A [Desulfuromusa sp.]